MRIVANGPPMRGRLVFLDTADWSYLESGKETSAAESLRALADAGEISFVVTFDHIVEAGGLRTGLRPRLAFMREFPGTVLFAVSGAQLLRLAAHDFALTALQEQPASEPFECFAMPDKSIDELVELVRQTRPLRLAHRLSAHITSRTNASAPVKTREEGDAQEKLQRLARLGDRKSFEAYLSKKAPRLGGFKGYLQRAATPLLIPLYDWASSRGILARAKHADFLFDELVTSVLPPKFSTDEKLIGGLAKLWVQPEALALMSPSLACVKAIAKAQSPALDVQKIESTAHDKHHATFAPLVDVFTCDKRNQPLIAQTLKLARCETHVVRTGCLADVAAYLNAKS